MCTVCTLTYKPQQWALGEDTQVKRCTDSYLTYTNRTQWKVIKKITKQSKGLRFRHPHSGQTSFSLRSPVPWSQVGLFLARLLDTSKPQALPALLAHSPSPLFTTACAYLKSNYSCCAHLILLPSLQSSSRLNLHPTTNLRRDLKEPPLPQGELSDSIQVRAVTERRQRQHQQPAEPTNLRQRQVLFTQL